MLILSVTLFETDSASYADQAEEIRCEEKRSSSKAFRAFLSFLPHNESSFNTRVDSGIRLLLYYLFLPLYNKRTKQ